MRTFFQRQFGTLGDEGLSTASRIRVSRYEICHRGDLVLLKRHGDRKLVCVLIWLLVEYGVKTLAIVAVWSTESKRLARGTVDTLVSEDALEIVPATDIIAALPYRLENNGLAQVLVPCEHRDTV